MQDINIISSNYMQSHDKHETWKLYFLILQCIKIATEMPIYYVSNGFRWCISAANSETLKCLYQKYFRCCVPFTGRHPGQQEQRLLPQNQTSSLLLKVGTSNLNNNRITLMLSARNHIQSELARLVKNMSWVWVRPRSLEFSPFAARFTQESY